MALHVLSFSLFCCAMVIMVLPLRLFVEAGSVTDLLCTGARTIPYNASATWDSPDIYNLTDCFTSPCLYPMEVLSIVSSS